MSHEFVASLIHNESRTCCITHMSVCLSTWSFMDKILNESRTLCYMTCDIRYSYVRMPIHLERIYVLDPHRILNESRTLCYMPCDIQYSSYIAREKHKKILCKILESRCILRHTHTHTHTLIRSVYIHAHAHKYAHTPNSRAHVRAHTHTHVRTHTNKHTCTLTQKYR